MVSPQPRLLNNRPLAVALVASLSLGAFGGAAANGHGQTSKLRAVETQASAPALEADTRSYIGTWALGDSNNNLFNVRLFPGGKAVSTAGINGTLAAGARQSSADQLRELGRWVAWGNGVRIDYTDGWTDWIYVGPEGPSHAAWQPGQSRTSVPTNFGPAVKLNGALAEVVGVYSFPPAQRDLKPYTATLLSNGQAFNDIDDRTGGVWILEGSTVVIDWISGWRTTMSINPATPLQLRHWAPNSDRKGPPSGGVRQGQRIE